MNGVCWMQVTQVQDNLVEHNTVEYPNSPATEGSVNRVSESWQTVRANVTHMTPFGVSLAGGSQILVLCVNLAIRTGYTRCGIQCSHSLTY